MGRRQPIAPTAASRGLVDTAQSAAAGTAGGLLAGPALNSLLGSGPVGVIVFGVIVVALIAGAVVLGIVRAGQDDQKP